MIRRRQMLGASTAALAAPAIVQRANAQSSFDWKQIKGQSIEVNYQLSPRGDLIAFTRRNNGLFAIGVIKPDGTGERILTEGFHNEGPTWAPNGRVLMFFRESPGAEGGPRIFSIDLTGYNERKIPTPSFASDPAWSPLLN